MSGMFTLTSWPDHFPNVKAYDKSPRPAPVSKAGDIVAWIRVFSKRSGITPAIANEALANCSEVAADFDISLPDYCRAGIDHIGRTILIASHIEGTQVDPYFSGHSEAVRRISEFYDAYRNSPLWYAAAVGDLYHERNYRLVNTDGLRIVDVGGIFPAGQF